MPRSSRWPDTAPDPLLVLDSGALFNMKKILKVGEQWTVFVKMADLIGTGHLAFPRQVGAEMIHADYPDTPGTWAAANKDRVIYPDPMDESIAEVLGVAPKLIDPDGEVKWEPADPHVVAMALECATHYPGVRVIVVSDDYVDRLPRKESVETACKRLDLECWRSEAFVDYMAAVMKAQP